jgi:hypothetical protein
MARFLAEAMDFSIPQSPDRLRNAISVLYNGHRVLPFPEVKQPEREAHHSPPYSPWLRLPGIELNELSIWLQLFIDLNECL